MASPAPVAASPSLSSLAGADAKSPNAAKKKAKKPEKPVKEDKEVAEPEILETEEPRLSEGSGTFYYDANVKYVGEWKRKEGVVVREGKGTHIDNDRVYEGEFVNDRMQGFGVMTFPDGSRYEGEFLADAYNGFGTYNFPDGCKYIGQWHDGKMHGDGVFVDERGNEFKGIFYNNYGPGLSPYLR
eukprot:JZ551567.1.p1 GENE.JZ551567.1~~JZ551567.1.p1  ORF type:complete len:185 (+),score=1.11 JZ551567.1:27-581(+)